MAKDNGGPAFPDYGQGRAARGMTLRDWFAGRAVSGFLAGVDKERLSDTMTEHNMSAPVAIAQIVGSIADAMIAERGKETDG